MFEQNDTDQILDARYQSFSRVYINDIHNAEIVNDDDSTNQQNMSKRCIIKIKNTLLSKVAICGIIVNIFESEKYYRLKIDDSTGCINVTLWKSSIFIDQSLNSSNNSINSHFNNVYALINSIQTRIKDETINNRLMYEPKQGDLILCRAQIKHFRQRIELNALTCSKVQSSTNEMIQIILPATLGNKVYSKESVSLQQYDEIKNLNSKTNNNNNNNNNNNEKKSILTDNFINLVNQKLIQMSSNPNTTLTNHSCNSYALFNFLKNNCPIEYKSITSKHVLDALKELEIRGLAYSCEDEFHYLPMDVNN